MRKTFRIKWMPHLLLWVFLAIVGGCASSDDEEGGYDDEAVGNQADQETDGEDAGGQENSYDNAEGEASDPYGNEESSEGDPYDEQGGAEGANNASGENNYAESDAAYSNEGMVSDTDNAAANTTAEGYNNVNNAPIEEQAALEQVEELPAAPAAEEQLAQSDGYQAPVEQAAPSPEQAVDEAPVARPIGGDNLFGGVPPVPGTRRIMAQGEAPEEYVVELGDSLYDICDQLLDEPEYWPKLWALNPFIKNPHFVFPGTRLRFYPGDEDNPPYLEVVSEDDVVPVDKHGLQEKDLVSQSTDEIDEQLGVMSDSRENQQGLEQTTTTVDSYGNYYYPRDLSVIVPAFIFSEEPANLGLVIGSPSGFTLLGEGNLVLIEGSGVAIGNTYLALRKSRDVYVEEAGYVGERYEVVAAIAVREALEDGIFLGKVVISRLGVLPDDILTGYKSVIRKVPVDPPKGGVGSGNIVVGFEYPEKRFGAAGNFVLLEKESGSLSVGQTVKIFQEYRKSSFLENVSDVTVGKVISDVYILDDSSDVYIGYAVRSDKEIWLGDTTLAN